MKTFTNSIAIGVIALTLSSVGFSAGMPNMTSTTPMGAAGSNAMMPLSMPQFQACKFQKYKHSFVGSWVNAFRQTKQLTADQAKIVAEAAVILYGDSTMQVGTVTAVPGNHGQQNYQIQITNTAGNVLSTVLMNGRNGKIIQPAQQAAPVSQPTTSQS
jgi:hypothetical protein